MEKVTLSVIDFGVSANAGNGNANTIALQRAVEAVQASGGGTLMIPAGSYEVSGSIVLNPPADSPVCLHGADGATLVQTAAAEAPIFQIGNEDDNVQPGGVLIEDVHVQGHSTSAPSRDDSVALDDTK